MKTSPGYKIVNNIYHITRENEYIDRVYDWEPVSDINSLHCAGWHKRDYPYADARGVYQVCHKDDIDSIGEDLSHEKIGYIGKSESLATRLYNLKIANKHNAGAYIKQSGNPQSHYYFRVLISNRNNYSDLEKQLHHEMKRLISFPFAWKLASGGREGYGVNIVNLIDKIDSEETLKYVQSKLTNRLTIMKRRRGVHE